MNEEKRIKSYLFKEWLFLKTHRPEILLNIYRHVVFTVNNQFEIFNISTDMLPRWGKNKCELLNFYRHFAPTAQDEIQPFHLSADILPLCAASCGQGKGVIFIIIDIMYLLIKTVSHFH